MVKNLKSYSGHPHMRLTDCLSEDKHNQLKFIDMLANTIHFVVRAVLYLQQEEVRFDLKQPKNGYKNKKIASRTIKP